jgi:hypothetical protein
MQFYFHGTLGQCEWRRSINRISVFACTLDIVHGSPLNEESALRESSAYREQSKLDKKYKIVPIGIISRDSSVFIGTKYKNIFRTEFA